MFSENSFEVNAVDEYIKESILVLDDYYKNCNYIINPQAINKCVILQEKVKALVELQYDDEIIVEEQFKNTLGWTYTITVKGICFGFIGESMDIFTDIVFLCDSIDFYEYAVKLEPKGTQIVFAIKDVYKPL